MPTSTLVTNKVLMLVAIFGYHITNFLKLSLLVPVRIFVSACPYLCLPANQQRFL